MGSPWTIAGAGVVLLLVFGWQFIAHPTRVAPTRDPAWYTWRANVVLQSDPGTVAAAWGPDGIFSGGYRVAVPVTGALLQRVAGVDEESFTSLMMIGIPVLTGLILGAAVFRSRRDPLAVYVMMLAAAALFLTEPYIGYLDDEAVLLLLSMSLAFVIPSATSWEARTALFLIGLLAVFVHPIACGLFFATLLAVFGSHLVTGRFRIALAIRSDGPMLLSVGSGMVAGLACWILGIWGPSAKLSDAATVPPHTRAFFVDRLSEWALSMRPLVTGPLILVAIVTTIVIVRRTRERADLFYVVSAWWLLPLAGVLTFLVSARPVPSYRFLDSTAAPIVLSGLGVTIAIRWFLRAGGVRRAAGLLASLLIVGALAWMVADGVQHRWSSQTNQWANESTRASLAAVHEVASAAGERPVILIMNHDGVDDPATHDNTTYGWAKTDTNVFRTALPGPMLQQSATFVGTVGDFLADRQTTGPSAAYDATTAMYLDDVRTRLRMDPAAPVVFLLRAFYGGVPPEQASADLAGGTAVGPGVAVVKGTGLWAPPADVVARALATGTARQRALATHPGPLSNPLHSLGVLIGVFLLFVLPGLIAAPWFELEDAPSRIALIPGTSIVLTIVSGIAVLAVWRGPLSTSKAWLVVGVAATVGMALRLRRRRSGRASDLLALVQPVEPDDRAD
jgi:hypothetical protein